MREDLLSIINTDQVHVVFLDRLYLFQRKESSSEKKTQTT